MPGLNWKRFGIKDITKYQYIVSIDLGHRQTSAHYAQITEDGSSVVQKAFITKNEESVIPTQFAEKNGKIILGDEAGKMDKPYIYFKNDPEKLKSGVLHYSENIPCETLMQKFIGAAVEEIEKYNAELTGKSILYIVGCPSGDVWFLDDNDVEYARILKKGCAKDIVVLHESRGALLKLKNEKNITFGKGEGILVFDFGSSTCDWTFMYTDSLGVIRMLDGTSPLGASLIDRKALEVLLEDAPVKAGVRNEVVGPVRIEIEIIDRKEIAYCAPSADNDIYIKLNRPELSSRDNKLVGEISPEFMHGITHGRIVSFTSAMYGKKSGTWAELCEEFMEGALSDITLKLPGVTLKKIMLTGGASGMHFIKDICKSVFKCSDDAIITDDYPSESISKGLAYAALADIESIKLSGEMQSRIAAFMESNTKGNSFETTVAGNIALEIADESFFENVIHGALKLWASERIEDLSPKSSVLYLMELAEIYARDELKKPHIGKKIEKAVNDALEYYTVYIRKELKNLYADRYGTAVPESLNFSLSKDSLQRLQAVISKIKISFVSEASVRKILGSVKGDKLNINGKRYLYGSCPAEGVWDGRAKLYNHYLNHEEERRESTVKEIISELYNSLRQDSYITAFKEETVKEFAAGIDGVVDTMALYV